jgi:hypothetical protein
MQLTRTKVAARSSTLPADAPITVWAELDQPATPPPLRLAAPQLADPHNPFDFTPWIIALAPYATQTTANLTPILTNGQIALAGSDSQIAPAGPGSPSPRVTLQDDDIPEGGFARPERAGDPRRDGSGKQAGNDRAKWREDIAFAARGLDALRSGHFKLAAQAADVNIDDIGAGIGAGIEMQVPHVFQQLLRNNDLTGRLGQKGRCLLEEWGRCWRRSQGYALPRRWLRRSRDHPR